MKPKETRNSTADETKKEIFSRRIGLRGKNTINSRLNHHRGLRGKKTYDKKKGLYPLNYPKIFNEYARRG
ncbi:MAG: hypothetical protein B6U97_04120 [Candidatus Altiarchaeales archaeon ex4484_96]|nr:MAG: hypothetical protein B6U97_04120 [Candidatus Altiarchaeales archaeon ex4484_96]